MNHILTECQLNAVLTLHDVARILKVSEITIRRMLRQGAIPAHRVGGQWRFLEEEILEWLKNQ